MRSIDTNCQSDIEFHQNRFSAVCITIIAWERRPLSDGSYFLRSTPDQVSWFRPHLQMALGLIEHAVHEAGFEA